MRVTKDECDKDFAEKKLETSDDKCKNCEHYHHCPFLSREHENIIYGA